MPNDMSPSWRPLASRIASFGKNYINPRDSSATPRPAKTRPPDVPRTQSWAQWAGDKVKGLSSSDGANSGVHKLSIFPGWAARRYRHATDNLREEPFDVDLFVSGYAASYTSPGNASRSQKAFIKLAKGFASLPKIPGSISPTEPSAPSQLTLTPSTEDLLKSINLPPRPEDINEESEIRALEEHFRNLEAEARSVKSDSDSIISRTSSASSVASDAPSTASASSSVHRLHLNLESRLQPFWSSVLSNRTVRLSLFTAPFNPRRNATDEAGHEPVAVQKVQTAADGSFQWRFAVPYDRLCTHPGTLEFVFGDPAVEHNFYVLAELLPPPLPDQVQTSYQARQVPGRALPSTVPTAISGIRIPLQHCPVRVISDIDDTVKLSSIMSGARAVFHNVFVKDLRDIIIPGMGDWYMAMWQRGVRFHYVSNGPFELLPVLSEFFEISSLPPGSIKLKSYAGRSLFNGLLSAPAARKRAGVAEILDNFADARFLLVGDSGEQDLELYAAFAAERPQQVLAVFVRDVSAYPEGDGGLPDPTGRHMHETMRELQGRGARLAAGVRNSKRTMSDLIVPGRSRASSLSSGQATPPLTPPVFPSASGSGSGSVPPSPRLRPQNLSRPPTPSGTPFSPAFFDMPYASEPERDPEATPVPRGYRASWQEGREGQQWGDDGAGTPQVRLPNGTDRRGSGGPQLPESERRRFELQNRVYKARAIIPEHIPLRLFREPSECVEAGEILDRLHVGMRATHDESADEVERTDWTV